ncbi:MAG: hypothetical protein H0V88_01570 [Pyrinomonadaceae bacterium]|nr:hypothetical protein [Pyrinomonadaceae bacterium]
MTMRLEKFSRLLMFAILCATCLTTGALGAASDESDVRGVVQGTFSQLRDGDYASLYDRLPSASRRRISRNQFVNQLQRTRDLYELDRLEINTVRVSNDVAVADTTAYGQIKTPFQGEGKIVLRQYLVREDGEWRLALEDRAGVQRLLASNRDFARRYPPRQPRFFLKRDGRWVDASQLNTMRRRSR